MNKLAIELLLKERQVLIGKRDAMVDALNVQISDIESGIERLSGKKVWETEPGFTYDDQNPDYIKASLEEI